MEEQTPYMKVAIEEARFGIHKGHGGPFASVIVKNGTIIGKGHNTVLKDNDSTAHGEINAIRNAEKELGTYDLSGAVLYTTGEPALCALQPAFGQTSLKFTTAAPSRTMQT